MTSAMLRTRWNLIRLIAFGSVAGITGLGLSKASGPQSTSSHATSLVVARDISGTWEGTFRSRFDVEARGAASARTVPARLHFNPVGDASPTTSSARSVHPGTFEIDFGRFGFTLSTQEALGWSVSDDSMRGDAEPDGRSRAGGGARHVPGTRSSGHGATCRIRAGAQWGTFAIRRVPAGVTQLRRHARGHQPALTRHDLREGIHVRRGRPEIHDTCPQRETRGRSLRSTDTPPHPPAGASAATHSPRSVSRAVVGRQRRRQAGGT